MRTERSPRRRRACSGAVLLAAALELASARLAGAGEVDVLQARAQCDAAGRCRFSVTLRHADVGWKHYADRFEVVAPDGRVLATRVLRHPHVHEQPFTRPLEGVEIPRELSRVTIRGHDSLHGHGGREVELRLPWPGAAGEAPTAGADG